jgi:glycosyltransferase involved in cell wall biosynthesis
MKVLYLINRYPSVSHTFIRREIAGLENLGVNVVRVSIRPPATDLVESADHEEALRTHCLLSKGAMSLFKPTVAVALRHPVKFLGGLLQTLKLAKRAERGLLVHFAYFAEACFLLGITRKENVDHVHVHFGTNPPVVALLCHAMGGPGFSFTVHGPEEYHRARSLKLLEKTAASRFAVAISRFGRSQMQLFTPPELHSKIHIVHCGLDSSFFDVTDITPAKGNRFLYVGRLCQQKQPLIMLEAASLLAREGVDFHIDIIGGGELLEQIESAIQEFGLSNHVTLLGVADGAQVRQHLRNSLALLMPSSAEGLPVVIMEAMAQHRPVLTTYIAAIPELVRDGVDGWLVPTGNVKALAEKMKTALSTSPDNLALMGDSAAARVRERHDIRTSAKRMVDLIEHYSSK